MMMESILAGEQAGFRRKKRNTTEQFLNCITMAENTH